MPVYLLCFDKKFRHAKHYIGFVEKNENLTKRLAHHRKGSGSKLMAAVAKAGIGFCVARIWPDGDRNFERKLKNRKKSSELCPYCIASKKETARRMKVLAQEKIVIAKLNEPTIIAKAEKLRQKHIAHLKANPPSPKMQAALKEVSTPEGFRAAFDLIKEHDEPLVCPVVQKAAELTTKPVIDMTGMAVHEMITKAKEIVNAQSQSDTNPSRWKRIWSRVARFLRLS